MQLSEMHGARRVKNEFLISKWKWGFSWTELSSSSTSFDQGRFVGFLPDNYKKCQRNGILTQEIMK